MLKISSLEDSKLPAPELRPSMLPLHQNSNEVATLLYHKLSYYHKLFKKGAKILFKGPESHFYLCGSLLQTSAGVKDLGIRIQFDLTWKIHLEERMKKANGVFYSLKRNVAFKVNMRIKLGLYKSLILSVLMYGSSCCNINRRDMRNLDWFQQNNYFLQWYVFFLGI